jgi:hypothetical protein
LVLTDFRDTGTDCPPEALHKYLLKHIPSPSPLFLMRFAETELESWLLADREAMARFLSVSLNSFPSEPDKEKFPKQVLINLARKSKKQAIKKALVPIKNHDGPVAPDYLPTMTDFIKNHWRPTEAAKNSPSLSRCIIRIHKLGNKS